MYDLLHDGSECDETMKNTEFYGRKCHAQLPQSDDDHGGAPMRPPEQGIDAPAEAPWGQGLLRPSNMDQSQNL